MVTKKTVARAEVEVSADSAKLNRGLRSADDRVKQFTRGVAGVGGPASSAFNSVGLAATGAAAAVGLLAAKVAGSLVDGFRSSVGAALSAEKAFAEVRTIADPAAFSIERIRDASRDLSAQFGGSIAGQAGALYQTISAGATDAATATETLIAANKLAIGGVAGLDVSIDGLTSVTNAYASSGLTATEASDQLFSAVRVGKTTVDELASSIGQVAPLASTAGVSFGELTGSIAALTLNGVRTAEAVTQIRGIVSAVIKPTSQAAEVAKELGISFSLAELQSRGLQGFLQYVASSGASTEQLGRLFGRVEALAGVLGLTGENGARAAATIDATSNAAGAADAAFAKVTETVGFQLERTQALGGAIAETFGRGIIESDLFRGSLDLLNSTLEATVGILEGDAISSGFDTFAATVSPALASVLSLQTAIEQVAASRNRIIAEEIGPRPNAPLRAENQGAPLTPAGQSPTAGRSLGGGDFDFAAFEAAAAKRLAAQQEADRAAAETESAAFASRLDAARAFLRSREEQLGAAAERRLALIDEGERRGLLTESQAADARLANAERLASELTAIEAGRSAQLDGVREALAARATIEQEAQNIRLNAQAEGAALELQILNQSLEAQRAAIETASAARAELILANTEEGAARAALVAENEALLQAELTRLTAEGEAARRQIEKQSGAERIATAKALGRQQLAVASGVLGVVSSLAQAGAAATAQGGKDAVAAQKVFGGIQIAASTAIGVARALELGPFAAAAGVAAALATGVGASIALASGTFPSAPTAASISAPPLPDFEAPDVGGRGRDEDRATTVFAVGDSEVDALVDLIADRINGADRVLIGRGSRQAQELRG